MMARKEAIVQSMTPAERSNPQIISGPRRRRIAAGCGQSVQEVNQFLHEFEQMRKMMRMAMQQKPGGGGLFGRKGKGGPPSGGGGGLPSFGKTPPKMPKGGKRRRFPFSR
jgi:signal recognition particle subunit SRP54